MRTTFVLGVLAAFWMWLLKLLWFMSWPVFCTCAT